MSTELKDVFTKEYDETEIGSVFVSNYPPYSFWTEDQVPKVKKAFEQPPPSDRPVGLYIHIPFCRKRCKFCYFRVYIGKNSEDIENYLDAMATEMDLYGKMPAVSSRPLKFVYFGGGTPSFISVKHLEQLVKQSKDRLDWSRAEEIAFECEPGTLSQPKLEAIRGIGVNRLSLGIENFNDRILRENGRAHETKEIFRVRPWIRELAFEQVNIDLIAGMVGETWETWKETVDQAIEYEADAVTVYQMELPFNTEYSKAILKGDGDVYAADWKTKREWNHYAMEKLREAGYSLSSAYTMVKNPEECRFVYRDSVWSGSDMIATGVSSFGHMNDVHYQNHDAWEDYVGALNEGRLPLDRAFETSDEERLTREVILQLKSGRLDRRYFTEKFGTDPMDRFSDQLNALRKKEMLLIGDNTIELTPPGLLRVDQILEAFYDSRYQNARYT